MVYSVFNNPVQPDRNMIILGLVAAVFGFISFKTWQGISNGIIGLWFFLSAIWFHLVLPWNFIILGIVMAALALWDALSHHTPHAASHSTA